MRWFFSFDSTAYSKFATPTMNRVYLLSAWRSMYLFCLVAILATQAPTDQPNDAVPPVARPAPRPTPSPHAVVLTEAPSGSPLALPISADAVPFGPELNSLYHKYRADGPFRGGVGLSFSLRGAQHRWTLTIGPIRFRFDGRQSHPTPP